MQELAFALLEETRKLVSADPNRYAELSDTEASVAAEDLEWMLSFFLTERDFERLLRRPAVRRGIAMLLSKVKKDTGMTFEGMDAEKGFGWRLVTPQELLGQDTWEKVYSSTGEVDHIGTLTAPLYLDADKGQYGLCLIAVGNYATPAIRWYQVYKNKVPKAWLYMEKFLRGPYGEVKVFPLPTVMLYFAKDKDLLNTRAYVVKTNVTDETFVIGLIAVSATYLKSIPSKLPTTT